MTAPGRGAEAVLGLEELASRSIDIVLDHQDRGGAYLAAPIPPPYRASWLRDGAFIADAMSRAGEVESAEAFFGWCCRVLEARSEQIDTLVARHELGEAIHSSEHLHARYTPAGEEVAGPWSSFQLDGYGAWVWALGLHADRHGGDAEGFRVGALLSLRYAAAFWREPCFDWWEERWGRHPATLAALYGGFRAGARWDRALDGCAAAVREVVLGAGVRDGRLVRELEDTKLDASLVACATPFQLLDAADPVMEATIEALERELVHQGVHRYAEDTYYGGGEWLLLAGFLGWHYAQAGRPHDARAQLAWMARKTGPDGELPEQADDCLLAPEARASWLDLWGPPAGPLLWSHAMFLTLALELGVEAPARDRAEL